MSALLPFKIRYLQQLASVRSFSQSWEVWRPLIDDILGPVPDGQRIFDLGDQLSDIFKANASEGRDQGQLSGGGTAWGLVGPDTMHSSGSYTLGPQLRLSWVGIFILLNIQTQLTLNIRTQLTLNIRTQLTLNIPNPTHPEYTESN